MKADWSKILRGVAVVCCVWASGALGQDQWMAPEIRPLLSRLQAMSHGVHSDAEWDALAADVQDRIDAARRDGDVEQMIDAAVILSQIQSEMRGEHKRAIEVLRRAKSEADADRPAGMYKLYVRLAEVYARLGDVQAIETLIAEYRNSRYYDPRPFDTVGGEKPGVAVRIPRPYAGGDPSLTVTTLRKYAREARLAPGRRFPVLQPDGRDPDVVRLDPSRSRLLLVDFWLPGWTAWERDLPTLVRLHRTYHQAGLSVVGVPLARIHPEQWTRLKHAGMTWPQVRLGRSEWALYGVTGDVTNFLVDPRGVILGRNLRGHQLEESIRLALQP